MSGKVYFIAPVDRSVVKIGYSENPLKRLRQISTGSHLELELLCEVPGTEADEMSLHSHFDCFRVRREWFVGHNEILETVRVIKETGKLPDHLLGNVLPIALPILARAAAVVGSQTIAAAIVGVAQQSFNEQVRTGKRVPAEWCIPLDLATAEAGERVSCHEMRPDLWPANFRPSKSQIAA